MSRADRAARERQAEEQDRIAHARPNIPPTPFNPDPTSWDSFCPGNRTSHHGWPEKKTTDLVDGQKVHTWRCGSCGRWLTVPAARATGGR